MRLYGVPTIQMEVITIGIHVFKIPTRGKGHCTEDGQHWWIKNSYFLPFLLFFSILYGLYGLVVVQVLYFWIEGWFRIPFQLVWGLYLVYRKSYINFSAGRSDLLQIWEFQQDGVLTCKPTVGFQCCFVEWKLGEGSFRCHRFKAVVLWHLFLPASPRLNIILCIV